MIRRSAVVAAAASLLALSSCATFNRNDVAARVGSHSLSSAGARALITPDDQHTTGDLLRAQMTAWIKLDVVDEQKAKAQYEKGLAGSQSVCLAAIPVAAIADTAPVLSALQSGMSFADAARQYSANQALATGGGTDTQKPFALVIVAGLLTRLLISIFLMPALYALVARPDDKLVV